jgi:CelD/BcsL family acetyltransferase involved in cellulose biosynthesis
MSGRLPLEASLQFLWRIVGQAADTIVHARTNVAVAGQRPPATTASAGRGAVTLSVHDDLAGVEQIWRSFQEAADCTPFQTFDWLSAWHRHIGALSGVTPAIVIGRLGDEIVLLLPLGVERGAFMRRLTFLGQDLCDYNAPLLAPDFARIAGSSFAEMWADIRALLQATPTLRHDTIALGKMPAKIGAQPNPMLQLDVQLNPSNAYETELGNDWEKFYAAKRSSSTRRRDRTKLKKLGDLGEVRFVNPDDGDLGKTLDTLVHQKTKSFARMGVGNLFAKPGHAAFFAELATAPRMRGLVHLSRLDVGSTWAAVNLGLTFRDCYYHILASYDDGEVSRFGPGAAHLRELLKFAIERGLRRFDFTIGDEPYKRDWCDSEQLLYDYSASATLRGLPVTALALGQRSAKRMIKHSAPLWALVVRVRTTVAAWRKKPDAPSIVPGAEPDER